MPKPIRTRPVSGAQVRAYTGKAEEYALIGMIYLCCGGVTVELPTER